MNRTFRDRSGQLQIREDHQMSFRGRHNISKIKVLIVLESLDAPATLKELRKLSGIPYNTLKARLAFWHLIRYCNRELVRARAGRDYFTYTKEDRGSQVLAKRVPREIIFKCLAEINAWRKMNNIAPLIVEGINGK